ncbi:MAG: hypothetical protein ACOYBC_05465 [Bilifractor sp.]
MKAREILIAPRITTRKIETLRARIESRVNGLLPSCIRYDKDKVQTSPRDMMPECMAEIDELCNQVNQLVKQKWKQIKRIERLCENLTDPEQKVVILKYYTCGHAMREIASEIGYSISNTYKIRRHAENEIEAQLGK